MTLPEVPHGFYHPWSCAEAEVFIPGGARPLDALRKTTHLGIGAHADDLEIMAYHGILAGLATGDRSFTGVTMTDGRSSARAQAYAAYSDQQMADTRLCEQRKAATVGHYGAMVQLQHASRAVQTVDDVAVAHDLDILLSLMKPDVVYTHNLADKHDTHVAVALRVIAALRRLPASARPTQLIGCEVWRDLDWLVDADKIAMPVDGEDELEAALLASFDSQIAGGKRYDLAARGRRRAHATFFESRATDDCSALIFGMDLTPLLRDASLEPRALLDAHLARFADDVRARIDKLR